jgi:hypothetical protein
VFEGSWLEKPRPLVIGAELARRLQADLGSKVVVSVHLDRTAALEITVCKQALADLS